MAAAAGSSSVVAVVNPVKPSIATTSTPSRQRVGRSASRVLNTCVEHPGTMSSSRDAPAPSATGVRSMMTVTCLSPCRVLSPHVLINAEDMHPVKTLRIVGQASVPFCQDGVARGVPRDPEPGLRYATPTGGPPRAHTTPRPGPRERSLHEARPQHRCPGTRAARTGHIGNAVSSSATSWPCHQTARAPHADGAAGRSWLSTCAKASSSAGGLRRCARRLGRPTSVRGSGRHGRSCHGTGLSGEAVCSCRRQERVGLPTPVWVP